MNGNGTLAGSGMFLWGAIAVVAIIVLVWLVRRANTSSAQALSEPAAAPVQNAMVVEDGISDEIVAVISAAVAAMSGTTQGFVLRSVRRAKETRSAWTNAGLAQNTQPF